MRSQRPTVADRIYNAIEKNGAVISLFQLAIEIGIDYSHAHQSVIPRMVEQKKIIVTKTRDRRGHPLRLEMPPGSGTRPEQNTHDTRRTAN